MGEMLKLAQYSLKNQCLTSGEIPREISKANAEVMLDRCFEKTAKEYLVKLFEKFQKIAGYNSKDFWNNSC